MAELAWPRWPTSSSSPTSATRASSSSSNFRSRRSGSMSLSPAPTRPPAMLPSLSSSNNGPRSGGRTSPTVSSSTSAGDRETTYTRRVRSRDTSAICSTRTRHSLTSAVALDACAYLHFATYDPKSPLYEVDFATLLGTNPSFAGDRSTNSRPTSTPASPARTMARSSTTSPTPPSARTSACSTTSRG